MNMKKVKAEAAGDLPEIVSDAVKTVSREIPGESRQAAKDATGYARRSVDQAQAAFEKASELAHGNVQAFDAVAGAFKTRSLDLQMKSIEIAQANVNAAFDFFRKALSVRD